jgi:hypothetical protein
MIFPCYYLFKEKGKKIAKINKHPFILTCSFPSFFGLLQRRFEDDIQHKIINKRM